MNVYDFDNTIFRGDSSAALYFFCLRRYPAVLAALPAQLAGAVRYLLAKRSGHPDKTVFKERVYRYFNFVSDMPGTVEQFWNLRLRRIKPWYLQQQQPEDVVISASPDFLIGPACSRLGIRFQLSSLVDPATGLYTGLNCHGEEKVRRFRAVFGDTPIHAFYSDSLSDTPMARLATQAWLVKGNRILPWPKL